MILVEMLEQVRGKEYALWKCGRCDRPPIRLGFKTGRNMRACYQCQQRQRLQEVEEIFAVKNLDVAERTCLMCGDKFKSRGNWNRRCQGCAPRAAIIAEENNLRGVKHDSTMRLIGDCVASDEELIRQLVY